VRAEWTRLMIVAAGFPARSKRLAVPILSRAVNCARCYDPTLLDSALALCRSSHQVPLFSCRLLALREAPGGGVRGKRTENVVPSSAEVTSTEPPCATAIAFVM
jgi:hypothetical protein